MILKRVLLVIMIKLFKDVDDTIGYFKVFNCKNANCYLESPVRRTDADDFHQTTNASVGRICWICAICRFSSIRGLRDAIERNLEIAQIQ